MNRWVQFNLLLLLFHSSFYYCKNSGTNTNHTKNHDTTTGTAIRIDPCHVTLTVAAFVMPTRSGPSSSHLYPPKDRSCCNGRIPRQPRWCDRITIANVGGGVSQRPRATVGDNAASNRPNDENNDDEHDTRQGTTVTDDAEVSHTVEENPNHQGIACEWMQRFQQLLSSVSDPSSHHHNNRPHIPPHDIPKVVRHVFIQPISNDTVVPTTTPFWRDMMAFTWNIITLEGTAQISDFLLCAANHQQQPDDDQHHHHHHLANHVNIASSQWSMDETKDIIRSTTTSNSGSTEMVEQIEFWCRFRTNIGVGRAHVRLQQEHQDHPVWKAYTLLTTLQSLHDRPWNVAPYHRPITGTTTTTTQSTGATTTADQSRPLPVEEEHGKPIPNRVYWHDQKAQYQQQQQEQPYVVIIGGGQAGLSLAARLQQLRIPYVVYEMGPTVGTSWRQHRYPSLYLHDPVYYNHMPYLEFPNTWPVFCPRNKIANFMECYVQLLDLNVVCRTKVRRAVQNQETKMWTIDIEQRIPNNSLGNSNNNSNDDDEITITKWTVQCHHIVFATGNSSHPRRPVLPQSQTPYRGIQIHSSQYQGGAAYRNNHKNIRHVIVVGSNNSALDICQDLWEQLSQTNGGTVETITMIQRTPGMVVSTQSVLRYGLGPLYSEEAPLHHEEADLVATTVPYKVALSTKWKLVTQQMEQNDAKLLKDLREAGYRLDNGPNGTGIFAKSATEGGGFYIDHGCAELIVRNQIAVRFATVTELQSDGVVIQHIDDPTCVETLPADMIVFATGFDTMDRYVQEICGTDVSNRVGRTWGLGLGHNPLKDPSPWEGELRNMWKPTTVDGLWFQGGNLAQNRHYSRYLALQLAARYMGIKPHVYGIPKPL